MFYFLISFGQVKLPFEKLIHALRNFPEDAMDPDTLLPMAYSIKVFLSCTVLICLVWFVVWYLTKFMTLLKETVWCSSLSTFICFTNACMPLYGYVLMIIRYPGAWRIWNISMIRRMGRTMRLQRMRNRLNEGCSHPGGVGAARHSSFFCRN